MSAVIALPLRGPDSDARVIAQLRRQLAEHQARERALIGAVEDGMEATVRVLAAATELRDPYTASHQRRVAELTLGIGRLLGLPADRLRGLELAAVIHDVGKLSVPSELLCKPGLITSAEFELIKGHAAAGAELLKGIEFAWPIREIVWQHHERLDGSGYPRGLKGDQILIEARILAVADVVDAMGYHRPYRSAPGILAALAEVQSGRGKRYDANCVDACLKLFRELGQRLPD
jgi:HD-GYP domain-containing protein (c-di-GMP phosphodiesterase class II)